MSQVGGVCGCDLTQADRHFDVSKRLQWFPPLTRTIAGQSTILIVDTTNDSQ
jgi:hypothetical protein